MKQHLIFVIAFFGIVLPVCAQSSYWIEGSIFQGAVFDATETFEYPSPLSDIRERYAPEEIDIVRAEHILSDNIDFHTFFVERMCTEIICRENLHLYNRQYWGFITKTRSDTVIWMQLISKNYSTKERLLHSWQSIIDGGEYDWSVAVNITHGFLYDMSISSTESGAIYLDCWGPARKTYFPLLPSDYKNFVPVRKKDVHLTESTIDITRLYMQDYTSALADNNPICCVWGNYEYYRILLQTHSIHTADSLFQNRILQMQVCANDTLFSTPISIGGFSSMDISNRIDRIDSTNVVLHKDNDSIALNYIDTTTIDDAYSMAKNYYIYRWFCGDYQVKEIGKEPAFIVHFTNDGRVVQDGRVICTYGLDYDVAGQDYLWIRDNISFSLSFFLIYKEGRQFQLYHSDVIDVADSVFPKGNLTYTLTKL